MEQDLSSINETTTENLETVIAGSPDSPAEPLEDLDKSFLSERSDVIVRKGSQDRVVLKNCYTETVEIALLTLNFDKQNRRDSISSEGLEGDFEDQLLRYNNNKLFIPGLTECFKDDNTKFHKFPGENILLETSTQLTVISNGDSLPVKLILTHYRILFVPSDQSYLVSKNLRSDYFSIPLNMINHFYKGIEKKNQAPNALYISSKSGQKFRLTFKSENSYDFTVICDIIDHLIPSNNSNAYFAFAFHTEYPKLEQAEKGWEIYNFEKEFTRQGIILTPELEQADTLSNVQRYAFKKIQNRLPDGSGMICDTYPEEIIVPGILDIDEIVKCSKFRTKNRFPALAYCYRPPIVGRLATIWRSSQCRHGLGLYNHRSEADELYLRLIGNPCLSQKEDEINVHIYDARPYLNAVANKMNGKGYENTTYYRNAEISFLKIHNIHNVRDNYKKLLRVAADLDSEKWATSIEHNGWIVSIASILTGAKTIIEKSLKKGINVLIHCSDGWDRTTQLVSLVQIMLDPYYRTIEGFGVLIEKDWVSFGHMFKTRNGWKSTNPFEEDKRSPIFLQFLDCVHQLLNQYPYEFEFNLRFLTDLAYYCRTGLFGNFLCDSQAEMMVNKIKEKTTSIWSFIISNKNMYTSCLKEGLEENGNLFRKEIMPNTSFVNLRFWKEFFSFHSIKPLDKAQFKNIEMDSKTDMYEVTLKYQLGRIEQLQRENELLMQRVKELTIEESEEKDENPKPHKRATGSNGKKKKDENEFLVVDEEECGNTKDVLEL